ncbi:DELTA-sagatoxin-Srs1a-like [Sphaeramia orbicularis]|uniref:DELTA-sagatoxin-Srs1a-like n=1 Tax=Sphaeramia orbicularis TaxID=375764 RepID=A0A672ZY39_9TELE|nr:DELTA-sagatoxin-Srs1a-like [Sphaeramia orbicularis]
MKINVGTILEVANRQCSVEITNNCSKYVLSKPSVHIVSGFCADPLPPLINPWSSGNALFAKTPNTACGSVGVFTYDLVDHVKKETTMKIAVMFSVPYDFNLYSNWFAVGIFDKYTVCNYELYYKMYYDNDKTFTRSKADGNSLTHEDSDVTVMATMSNSYQPVMKVEVN